MKIKILIGILAIYTIVHADSYRLVNASQSPMFVSVFFQKPKESREFFYGPAAQLHGNQTQVIVVERYPVTLHVSRFQSDFDQAKGHVVQHADRGVRHVISSEDTYGKKVLVTFNPGDNGSVLMNIQKDKS